MKKWIENNLIKASMIASIIFAVIIHCTFSIPAPNEWFEAKWGAGELLTYVSTITLGLLAVWQNKRFKEENDKSQKRMEELANNANEISLLSKVIEYESARISRLKYLQHNFSEACSMASASAEISDVSEKQADFRKIYVKIKMDNRFAQIKRYGIELLCELELYDNEYNINELIGCTSKYIDAALQMVQSMRTMSILEIKYDEKKEAEIEFIKGMNDFIFRRELFLNNVILGVYSLEEIRGMYKENMRE